MKNMSAIASFFYILLPFLLLCAVTEKDLHFRKKYVEIIIKPFFRATCMDILNTY